MGTPTAASNPTRDQLIRNWARKLVQKKTVAEIEAQVDLESAKLWNLPASDLADMQRSLNELTE